MSTPIPPERFRRPDRPPTRLELDNARDWPAYQARGLDDVKASANKWRDGLGALVTVVTGALVVSGPDAIAKVDAPWRYLITGLLFFGYALTVLGLWHALRAAAGNPTAVSLADLQDREVSIREREVARAVADANRIRIARRIVIGAMVFLWLGTLTWWLAPQQSPGDTTFDNQLRVVLTDKTDLCGTLLAIEDDDLVIDVAGSSAPQLVPLNDIQVLDAGDCS